jgi:hypothetical protein
VGQGEHVRGGGCRFGIPCRRDRWLHGPWLSFFACALSATIAEPKATAWREGAATSSNLLVGSRRVALTNVPGCDGFRTTASSS